MNIDYKTLSKHKALNYLFTFKFLSYEITTRKKLKIAVID